MSHMSVFTSSDDCRMSISCSLTLKLRNTCSKHLAIASPNDRTQERTSGCFLERGSFGLTVSRLFGRVWDCDLSHEGEQHQRQRKIMNPAFSVPQLKSFTPLYLRYANKVRTIAINDGEFLANMNFSWSKSGKTKRLHRLLERTLSSMCTSGCLGRHLTSSETAGFH